MLHQPGICLILCLAPNFVLTVANKDERSVEFWVEPVGLGHYVVAVHETKWLVVPGSRVFWHESRQVLVIALPDLVLMHHLLTFSLCLLDQCIPQHIDVRVVEDVEIVFKVCQAEDKIHAVVVFSKLNLLFSHLIS